jgi:hypothetical protein
VPVQLQRAMAAEAEAAREARAKVVAAEGEQKASFHLKEAALVLEESTSALQLRYLQVNLVLNPILRKFPPLPYNVCKCQYVSLYYFKFENILTSWLVIVNFFLSY